MQRLCEGPPEGGCKQHGLDLDNTGLVEPCPPCMDSKPLTDFETVEGGLLAVLEDTVTGDTVWPRCGRVSRRQRAAEGGKHVPFLHVWRRCAWTSVYCY